MSRASSASRENILTVQLKMLEAFTDAEDWLTTNDLQEILDLAGIPVQLRLVQRYVKLLLDMGLVVVCPKTTLPVGCSRRYKKSGKIAVVYDHN